MVERGSVVAIVCVYEMDGGVVASDGPKLDEVRDVVGWWASLRTPGGVEVRDWIGLARLMLFGVGHVHAVQR